VSEVIKTGHVGTGHNTHGVSVLGQISGEEKRAPGAGSIFRREGERNKKDSFTIVIHASVADRGFAK
jgi:hypothetical protein